MLIILSVLIVASAERRGELGELVGHVLAVIRGQGAAIVSSAHAARARAGHSPPAASAMASSGAQICS